MVRTSREALRSCLAALGGGRLAAASDLALAALVALVVAMMVVPLPPLALDFLIALNLAISLGLLLAALYVGEPSRLAALPSVLLLATLFRLGLNVATTRLVLLRGDAGAIVEAFGRVVVAGNVVVGAVVFAVLALVQFVVVAKGAERVAEVAARFTLDALPGKQMSIDADLRAGAVGLEEAQRRRTALERESQLYGALDGAMKFVKGDAVAGLAIVAINIVGGLAVGVLQRGMGLAEAAAHYTVLTVGDGLAAQIPSLLVSTTAGLVVTRVPGEGAHLGADISGQIGAQPRALALTGALLAALALAPGLPAAPFLALGLAAGGAAFARSRRGRAPDRARPRRAPDDAGDLTLRNAPPVRVALGSRALEWAGGADGLASRLPAVRSRLAGELGLRAPAVEVVGADGAPPAAYEISVGACVWASGTLPPEPRWVDATPEELRPLGVDAARRADDAGLAWTGEAGALRAAEAGFVAGDRADFVALVLERVLGANAAEFVGVQEARDLADALEATHPALVAEVLPRVVSLAQLAEVLRRLVAERVSIADLRAIFEALAAAGPGERDTTALVERVRGHLRRRLTRDAAGAATSLPVYVLSPDVEAAFVEAARYASGPLAVEPYVARALCEAAARAEAAPRERGAPRPVLVVPREIRPYVRAAVEAACPDLRVYSFHDLAPSLVLRPVATLG